MPKLNLHLTRDDGDAPDSLPFPRVAQWEAAARRCARRAEAKIPYQDAVKMVEAAMRDAQLKFDRLRAMLGFPHDDRPRAA
jgi:hypothetical protein